MRSLWHLSRHLTARADDNQAAPSQRPRRASLSPNPSSAIQARVRFLAYHRIKPHVPPLVRPPSIPLSFNLAVVLPRWITYCVNCGAEGVNPPTPSNHRLQCGLPGYLILFATHTFEPQRQLVPSRPPSPLVFLPISTHSTATPGIPPTSALLKKNSFESSSWVEPMDFTSNLSSRLRSLYTQ